MRRYAVLFFCACTLAAAADIEERSISRSPRTQEELDAVTKTWRERGYSDETIDRMLQDPNYATTYRDADIKQAFPELSPDDQQAYFCTNRSMSGATDIAYWSRIKAHRVKVTHIGCIAGEAGLKCNRMETTRATYLDDPKQFFNLEDGVSLEEAREVFSRLDAFGMVGADPWFSGLRSADVRGIGRTGNAFRLNFGDSLVCGCMAQVLVQIEQAYAGHPEQRLRVVGQPDGQCV